MTAVRYRGSNDDPGEPGDPEGDLVLDDHADLAIALGLDSGCGLRGRERAQRSGGVCGRTGRAGLRAHARSARGRDRRRSGDLTLFRRALCQLSYPTKSFRQNDETSGPDGI